MSYLTPRDNTLWVFGTGGGTRYTGNAKYLFTYTADTANTVRAVWLTCDSDIAAGLREEGYEAYHRDSVRGIYLGLRAGVTIVTHDNRDVNPWAVGRSRVICLWHGFPLKRILWDARLSEAPVYVKAIFLLNSRWDRLFIPSAVSADPFASGLRHEPTKMRVTGYPRNDALLNVEAKPDNTPGDTAISSVDVEGDDTVVVLYAPTYRSYDVNPCQTLDWGAVNERLADINGHLLIKAHPGQPANIDVAYNRITELPEDMDLYPLLPETDALITDYSSIYFDYLLLDKPVIFYAFDLERYQQERGLYFSYDRFTPGPIVTDEAELLDVLETIRTDEYATERSAVQKETMPRFGERFSARAYRTIAKEVPGVPTEQAESI